MVFTRALQIIDFFLIQWLKWKERICLLDLEWKIFASSTNQKLFCIQENVLFHGFLVKVKGI